MRGKENGIRSQCGRRTGRKKERRDRGGADGEVRGVGEEGFNRWERQGKE